MDAAKSLLLKGDLEVCVFVDGAEIRILFEVCRAVARYG